MTITIYLGGVQQGNPITFEPTADGQIDRDGRTPCEIVMESSGYAASGSAWKSDFNITANVYSGYRLIRSSTTFDFSYNPQSIPQPADPLYHYYASGSGPRQVLVRDRTGLSPYDNEAYSYQGSVWRYNVKLYFARISYKIIHAATGSKLIMRSNAAHGDTILRDA
ncbi:MAG: hypothetical protein IIZ06_07465 [Kiritimatiellae bacterium]|nr:hypothetical protein [Kiritimatiellia bacterium]